MSEKYTKYSSKSSRKYKDDSAKSKTRKSSYHNLSKYHNGSKTPPLPTKNDEIEDLLKKRQSLKHELQRLEQRNIGTKYEKSTADTKKRKHSDKTTFIKHPKPQKEKKLQETRSRELSPDYLESEDEENIIELRRKQRKKLLEKFNENEKTDVTIPESEFQRESIEDTLEGESKSNNVNNDAKTDIVTDMFSEKDDFVHKNTKGTISKDDNNSQLTDNWDDAEGYYNIRLGDVVNQKYTIKDILGQGVFANVVRAQDNKSKQFYAIKIVRNNELMYKTSLKEISILKEINEADPENKYHCVKFFGNFMHRGHLCLLLESLHMDLRAVLKKYGKNHGIHMKALISYSRQLLMALRLLKKVSIIHADIKPDNILVNEKKNVLKLCDFGSATKSDENDFTPYLVSRFYRAPEIILGLNYSYGIDIWSTACTIYEMTTGKILFTGSSNNRMLKCFMDLKGKIPSKMIRKGKFKDQHFNYNNNFLLHKKDEFSGRDKVVEIYNNNAVRDLHKDLQKSCKNLSSGEEKKLLQMKDLLEKMLILDPNQRASVSDCLKHQFIQEELQK